MKRHYSAFLSRLSLASLVLLLACSKIKTGASLSASDINHIKTLGILNNEEKIILFETHAGLFNSIETSGSYFTDQRIASYWIDNRDKSKTTINTAYYSEIDTITTLDLSQDLTAASYLAIKKKNGQTFNVFISPSQEETTLFFNKAIALWQQHKRKSPSGATYR